jgi:rod shape-determining protein MreD
MKGRLWIDIVLLLLFILMQLLLFRHLEFWGLETDIVFIFLVWLASVRDRTYALILTAIGALLMDILLDTWGVHLFSKTLLILFAHGFVQQQRENIRQAGQFFTLFLIISLAYNLIFLLISSFAGHYSTEFQFFKYWIGNSVYFALTALVLFILKPE